MVNLFLLTVLTLVGLTSLVQVSGQQQRQQPRQPQQPRGRSGAPTQAPPPPVWKVILYKDIQGGGDWTTLTGPGCSDVPGGFNDVASSLRVLAGCVQLFKDFNCQKPLASFTGDDIMRNDNFKDSGFNDQVSSVGECNAPPTLPPAGN